MYHKYYDLRCDKIYNNDNCCANVDHLAVHLMSVVLAVIFVFINYLLLYFTAFLLCISSCTITCWHC